MYRTFTLSAKAKTSTEENPVMLIMLPIQRNDDEKDTSATPVTVSAFVKLLDDTVIVKELPPTVHHAFPLTTKESTANAAWLAPTAEPVNEFPRISMDE